MRKSLVMLLVVIFSISAVFAATVEKNLNVNRGSDVSFSVQIDTDGIAQIKRDIDGKVYTRLTLDNSAVTLEKGMPELRTVSAFLAMPLPEQAKVEVLEKDVEVINNINIIPSKGSITRNINPEDVEYTFSDVYSKDQYYPKELLSSVEPFILRDISGIRVEITPFRYNPVEKTLQIVKSFEVKVSSPSNRGYGSRVSAFISEEFEKLYSDVFMNYTSPFITKDGGFNAPAETKNLLIVSANDYLPAAQELADWKTKTGFTVIVKDYSELGSKEALADYISDLYAQGELCFVTFLGEYEDIPTLKGKQENANSDTMYVKLAGSDNVPDAFISRLSVKSLDAAYAVVRKTIKYEKTPEMGNWYKQGLGIASSEGSPKDYERCEVLNDALKNELGFTKVYECFAPDSGGGWWKDDPYNPYDPYDPYNPTNPMEPMPYYKSARANSSDKSIIFNATEDGVSVINYIGHGSDYTWVTSGFSTSDAKKLNNGMKLPVIWDVACVNGALHRNECFAEAWQNSGDENGGGSIGIAAASTNMAWVPPCVWQEEIIAEQMGKKMHDRGAVLNVYGMLKCMEEYGSTDSSQGNQLVEQVIYFGEGSVAIRTEVPRQVSAEAIRVDGKIMVAIDGMDTKNFTDGVIVTAYDNNLDKVETVRADGRSDIVMEDNGQTHITIWSKNIVPVVDLEIQ